MIELGKVYNISEGICTVMGYKDKDNIFVRLEDGSDLKISLDHLKKGVKERENIKRQRLRKIWTGIHARCGKHKNYIDCFVDPRWDKFEHFYNWAKKQIGHERPDFQLDKDILFQSNRCYGPDTCCFVPVQINSVGRVLKSRDLPIGVQKYRNKYVARFTEDGKTKTIGVFDTPEEASNCYKLNKIRIIKNIAETYRLEIDVKLYIAIQNYEVQTI